MATGAPDWQGLNWKVESIQRPNYLYPSGRMLLGDTFNEPVLGWTTGGTGTEVVNLTTAKFLTPPSSVYMETGTTINNTAWILRRFGIPSTQKIGIQLTYNLGGYVNNILEILLTRFTTTASYHADIRFNGEEDRWEYNNSLGNWAVIPGFASPVSRDSLTWHRLKMTVDFSKNTYIRLLSNEDAINMDTLEIEEGGAGSGNHLQFYIQARTPEAVVKKIWIDEILMTEED